jgi:hypothetical protein
MEKDREGEWTRAESIDENEIKAFLNRWGKEGFFRAKGWGDKIRVVAVRPLPYYLLYLETQYEHRTTDVRKVPYEGKPLDPLEPSPDLWEVEVPAPVTFDSKRVENIEIPHTESTVRCEGCKGTGRVDCPNCKGLGCATCQSQGWLDHTDCDGKGYFRQFRTITSEFTCSAVNDRLVSAALPEKLVREAGTEVLSDRWRKGGGFLPDDLSSEMMPCLEDLWKQSLPKDSSSTRILFQRYRIERLKGYEVLYQMPDSTAPRKLWIVGDKKRVYAPKAPLAWERVLGVAVPSAAVLLVLITSISPFFGGSRRGGIQAASVIESEGYSGADRSRDLLPPANGKTSGNGTKIIALPMASGQIAANSKNQATQKSSDTTSEGGDDTPDTEDVSDESETSDSAPNDEDSNPFALNTYDVLAGIYSDPADAQEVADQLESAAYDPEVTATQGTGTSLNMVFIKGFLSRETAEATVQDLKDKGISTQARVVPIPITSSVTASANAPSPAAQATAPAPGPSPMPDIAPDEAVTDQEEAVTDQPESQSDNSPNGEQ